MTHQITFVVPVADEAIYDQCFRSSPLFKSGSLFEVFCQRGFSSAAAAYNAAIDGASHDLIVFCHQDILLPASWAVQMSNRLAELGSQDMAWGVVGCAGRTQEGKVAAHIYRHDRELRGDVPLPSRVRTLDESIIAFRRSSGLRFDEQLKGFFFYAVDICLQAEAVGLHNYAVDAPCFHQAKDRASLAPSFFETEKWIVEKWRKQLPIQTLSGCVAGGGYLMYKRLRNRLDEFLARHGCARQHWWHELPKITPDDHLR